MHAVNQVIGGHNRHGLRRLHRDFKAPQIDFPERSFGNDAVTAHAVVFLIIAGKMLDGGSHAITALNPLRNGRRHTAA